ncbi:MAG: glycosyltransferase [Elusimicrobiaceae bacterium]|nr:glycosyltransferase [Elusimicrobiaceae bacterium]
MPPKISVLIPVYNAEKYLPACLQSICAQTFKDFEIVCLDDGSCDGSVQWLRTMQSHEPRLRIITQANAGVAAARNRLLKQARGEYIAFIDADDLVKPEYLEKLYAAAQVNRADIAKCFFQEISEDGLQVSSAHCGSLFYQKPSQTLLSRFVCGYHDSVVWGKLFRRSWLHDEKISFFEGRIAEDLPFVVESFMQAHDIVVVPQFLYFYRKGLAASITAQSEKMRVDQLKNLLDLQGVLQKRNWWKEDTASFWTKTVVWRICAFRKLPVAQRKQYLALQQQAFSLVEQVVRTSGWRIKLRWSGLIIAVRLCGRRSVYVWTKIFR